MKTLQEALHQYLSMRSGFGFKFQKQGQRLKSFLAFLQQRGATHITCKLALEWATQCARRPSYCASRLSDVRGFARHLLNIDPRTEVPPQGLIRGGNRRPKPYLYTEQEICQLMSAAAELPPRNGLRCRTYPCLFGLLAVTGMRISEALNLKGEDADLKEGVLTIRETKFGKSRVITLHPSSQQTLIRYSQQRDAHVVKPRCPYFLVDEQGGPLRYKQVHAVFIELSRQIGLRARHARTGPRLHDFRHRHAVETLLRWHRAGEDIDARLPTLSTFLGHSDVRSTYWYLSASSELMQEAALRLQKRWEVRS
jgi:integrase